MNFFLLESPGKYPKLRLRFHAQIHFPVDEKGYLSIKFICRLHSFYDKKDFLQHSPTTLDHCAGGRNSGYCLGNVSRSQKVVIVTLYEAKRPGRQEVPSTALSEAVNRANVTRSILEEFFSGKFPRPLEQRVSGSQGCDGQTMWRRRRLRRCSRRRRRRTRQARFSLA